MGGKKEGHAQCVVNPLFLLKDFCSINIHYIHGGAGVGAGMTKVEGGREGG